MHCIIEVILQILVDDDDVKDGGSDEGEVEELNIVLGNFSIRNNIDFILDEQEGLSKNDVYWRVWLMLKSSIQWQASHIQQVVLLSNPCG